MCGLAGYIDFTGRSIKTNSTMRDMLELQRHRGPDDQGIVVADANDQRIHEVATDQVVELEKPSSLILGFNRLSILDLSQNGHQPMQSANGKVALMLNGEVYNAFDFSDDLISRGYRFRGQTDTEVVLCLYLEYGFDAMIKMLNGMFAIVVLDMDINRIFLARDRFGIKPLYIYQNRQQLAFSSELKSFKALSQFKFELAENNLDEFLLFRNLINRTLLKNIENLPPGQYWECDLSGSIEKKVYHDFRSGSVVSNTDLSGADEIARLVDRAVQRQMISDVKLGSQLSGGIDSSIVSNYAAQSLSKGSLDAVSIVFENKSFSEKQYVDYVTDQMKLVSHQYTLTPDYYIDNLERATWHFENPLNHPNTVGIYLLSAEAKKEVTVLLSGEGADEVFAGYNRFITHRKGLLSRQLLIDLKKNRKQFSQFLNYYLNDDIRLIMSSVFSSLDVVHSVNPDFDFKQAIRHRQEIVKAITSNGLLKHRQYEIMTYLPDLLMRQDKMSMAHSIENRVPFLDNELVEAALQLSDRDLIRGVSGRTESKYVLKEIAAELFGETFAYRDKMGFGIPLREFMLTSLFRQKLKDEYLPGIAQRGYFAKSTINTWADNIANLSNDQLDGLWLMIGFEEWAKQFLDN